MTSRLLLSIGCSSLSTVGHVMGVLGTVLLLITGGLLIRMIVGRILALLLAVTRQEISILDCASYENSVDDPMVLFAWQRVDKGAGDARLADAGLADK